MSFNMQSNNHGQDDGYDLGTYTRTVTTKDPRAQYWFNRGLIWTHAFNHHEAARSFEKAIEFDPTCAMAHWGLAYTIGPHYNKPWSTFSTTELSIVLPRAHSAITLAKSHLSSGSSSSTPVESALILALQSRYQSPLPPSSPSTFGTWSSDYAEAMTKVHSRFPSDPDVSMLCADALLNLSPWNVWDLRTGEPAAGARTLEIQRIFTRAFASIPSAKTHPGLLHLYVHFVEMSPEPETGLPAGDTLRTLVPDAGHLLHMASHLDLLVGDYRRAMASNLRGIEADEKYLAKAGYRNFYTNYRVHNHHSLVYAAMLAGDWATASEAVGKLEGAIPEDLLHCVAPPMANFLEAYIAVRPHVLVRFGKWEEVKGLEIPGDEKLFCVTIATTLYAKGIACAVLGEVDEAERYRCLFREALGRVPVERTAYPNRCVDILAVGVEMLDGEIAYRKGSFEVAFAYLRKAVELDDGLTYNEPWGWMQPARHALAALLLEQGRVEESAEVYAADLGLDNGESGCKRRNPNNIWALKGFSECLKRMGRMAEVRLLEPQLKLALKGADIDIGVSCFCARGKKECGKAKMGEITREVMEEKMEQMIEVLEVDVSP